METHAFLKCNLEFRRKGEVCFEKYPVSAIFQPFLGKVYFLRATKISAYLQSP